MTGDDWLTDSNSLPPTFANQVDEICDRFEADFQAGARPTIEACLAGSEDALRSALFRALELELISSSGGRPEVREYAERFPSYVVEIETVFAADELRRARPLDDTGE